MSALREILADFFIKVDDSQLKKADKNVSGFNKLLKDMGGLLAGALTIGAARSFVQEMVGLSDQLVDTSAALGISAQALQQWQYAGSLVGAEAGDISTAFKKLQLAAADNKSAFKDIGVNPKDFATTEDLMRGVARGIAELETNEQRTAAASDLLGKAGTKLIPVFNEGAEGVDKLLAELDELGGGIGDDALVVLDDLGDQMTKFDTASTSLKSRLAVALLPTLTKVFDVLTRWVAALSRNKAAVQGLTVVIGALGTVALVAGAKAAAPWLALAAAVGLAFLVVQDFIVFMRGGDSLIGRAVEKAFGPGSGNKLRTLLKTWGDDIQKAFSEGFDKGLKAVLDKAGIVIEEFLSSAGAELVKFLAEDLPAAGEVGSKRIAETGGSFEDWAVVVGNALNPVGWVVNMKKGFEEMYAIGKQAIDDLIRGMTFGMADGTGTLSRAVADMVTGGIKEPMKGPGGLDSHSPSRFGMREADNLADGFTGRLGALRQGFATASLGAARSAATGFAGGARSIAMHQTNQNTFHVRGGTEGLRESVSGAMADEREAALAALESVAVG
jgi:hypothetical protein